MKGPETAARPSGLNGRWKYSKAVAALAAGVGAGATAYFGAHSVTAGLVALVLPVLLTVFAPANKA
jgi:uncharacterized protein (DUF2062 family)